MGSIFVPITAFARGTNTILNKSRVIRDAPRPRARYQTRGHGESLPCQSQEEAWRIARQIFTSAINNQQKKEIRCRSMEGLRCHSGRRVQM